MIKRFFLAVLKTITKLVKRTVNWCLLKSNWNSMKQIVASFGYKTHRTLLPAPELYQRKTNTGLGLKVALYGLFVGVLGIMAFIIFLAFPLTNFHTVVASLAAIFFLFLILLMVFMLMVNN